MSRFVGSAWLKLAQLGWLSQFEPSRGNTRAWGPGPRPHLGSDRKRSVGATMYSTGDPYPVKAPVTRGVTSASG
jgi:hypothetical protein